VQVPIPGWNTTGKLTVWSYRTGGGFPTASDPGPGQRGANMFIGGDSADGTLTQGVDLRACVPLIDQGALTYELSAHLGGFGAQTDHASLSASLRDLADQPLGTVRLETVTPGDRGYQTGLWRRASSGDVPVGTRRAFVTLTAARLEGVSNDGYADNLSLVLRIKP
jgi:hypothetical protein